jgi:hypothetical protein
MGAPPGGPVTPLDRLDDYVSGHMSDADAAAYEDELFAAGASSAGATHDAAQFLDGVARMAALYEKGGGFLEGGTRAQVDALRAAGARVHFIDLGPGSAGPIPFPAWGAGYDIVVARLAVDLREQGLVDVEVETADGRPVKTFREVGCDPTDGALYAICQEPLARLAFGRGRTINRVIATKAGRRETVAVFDINPTG